MDKDNHITVMGMVIGTSPMGENNKRVVLLTREMGKISCFARGARRPGSSLLAAADLFCFGKFHLYAGKDSYTMTEAEITNYFPYFRTNAENACLASYFLEVMEFCTRENNDEAGKLLLLYLALSALSSEKIAPGLIRSIFEIRTVILEGEYPGIPEGQSFSDAALMALRRIEEADAGHVFSFSLTKKPQEELADFADLCMWKCFHHHFQSLTVYRTVSGT